MTLKINKGDVFGRLTIIKQVANKSRRVFLCKCECGNKSSVILNNLRRGTTVSCGCYGLEVRTTHGLRNHPLYDVYTNMMHRCYNSKDKFFKYYGGKGIKVCNAWKNKKDGAGLTAFISWNDSLPKNKRWKPGLEIDRQINTGNYGPDNCRWVTRHVNLGNRSNTRKVLYKNKEYSFKDFYTKFNTNVISYKSALERYRLLGWTAIESVTIASGCKRA